MYVLITIVQAIRLIQFILTTFTHDEEIQSIHLPIIFAGVIDFLAVRLVSILSNFL